MRKIILVLAIFFVCPVPVKCAEGVSRDLFVTVLQEPAVFSGSAEIIKLIDFAKKARIKIIFLQIYRANQAWFFTKVADPTPYQGCLRNLSIDPFALLIKQAHAEGIQVHAWLNLLSLSQNKDACFIKKYGSGVLTRNVKEKKTLEDYKIDNQYFLEPGDPRVRDDLTRIIEEILYAYPELDGIQFDYIRYPDKNPAYGYTETNIERFKKETGLQTIVEKNPAWQNWKRDQVSGLLKMLVQKTRVIHPDIRISVTGCMPYARAYYEAFQDWLSWLDQGLVDFVTAMNYSADPQEFERWSNALKNKTGYFNKINIAVGAYKLVRSPKIFEEEFRICEKAGAGDCVVFHYGSLLENPALGDFLINP